MKFHVIKIDIERLNHKIDSYYNNCRVSSPPYLFMNVETCNALAKEFDVLPNELILRTKYPNGLISKYNGNKIFIDEDLDFGEVEIR